MKRVIIAALAIVAMAGCTKESDPNNTERVETSFSSTIESRASGTEWESGDVIGIMVTSGGDLLSSYRYNNKYTVSFESETPETGIFAAATTDDVIYYSDDETVYINFYAYYPYNAALVEADMTYPIDVSVQSTPQTIDFMEASTSSSSGYNKKSGTVAFAFSRKMAKISLTLVGGTGVATSDIVGVSLEGFYTSATYDFPTNSFTKAGGESVAIVPCSEGDNRYSAILIPQGATSQMVYFTLSNGERVPLDLTSTTLSSGKHTSYTVTVSQTAATYKENTINGWDDSGVGGDLLTE